MNGDAQSQNDLVALTAALEDRMRTGELRSMDKVAVGMYLQKKLHWLLVDVRPSDPGNLTHAFCHFANPTVSGR
jgi:hypothetical protein